MMEKVKYQYTGIEHTLVRLSPNSDKVRIESGEIFESSCDPKIFTTYFKKIDSSVEEGVWKEYKEKEVSTPEEKEVSTKSILIKQYIEKFGKRPSPKWNEEQLLEKLAE